MAVDPLLFGTSASFNDDVSASGSGSLLEAAPFPIDQTFLLHSLPTATKTIYLDFNGHITRDTQWNVEFEAPTIITPNFSNDSDPAISDSELLFIQSVWEQVAEDFRPFNVNVTTEEPPEEDLMRGDFSDERWGMRVCIGGTNQDWLFDDAVGGIAYLNSFAGPTDTPCFVFNKGNNSTPLTISHEVGHTLGLGHDGEIVPPVDGEEQDPIEYDAGHGTGPTGWGAIMGAPFAQELSQWSRGEYPLATNAEDDLAIITSFNGFTYRADDHGNSRFAASDLGTTSASYSSEGVIEQNTDVDYFEFIVTGQGEAVTFDINPFHNRPNLDILAKLYNSSGTVLATSNPRDTLDAEFSMNLAAGTYYISVEGTGREQTSATDFGYTDYGSLGYFSIAGTRKELLVGVDFDIVGGAVPTNWTRYTGSPSPAVLNDLKNEGNFTTPFNLAISTAGAPITKTSSTINAPTIPEHSQLLDNLGGYHSSSAWNFVWSDLAPSTAYEIFVFGLGGSAGTNNVQIVGAGVETFTQALTANDLYVNAGIGSSAEELSDYGLTVVSSALGTIEINVTPQSGSASLGGLGIRPAKLGAIEGQKWNDLNGDTIRDSDELGLPGWTIYLDANDNGVWDAHTQQSLPSDDVPQPIANNVTVKSELLFQGISTIEDLDVTLNIAHTFVADLDVFLISPAGTRVELFTDVGGAVGGSLDNFFGTTLDDEAATAITAGTAPYSGRFRPEGLLSILDGEDPNGIWTLEITDDANNNTGSLTSWSIAVTGSELFTVTDEEGNYAFEDLPPGIYHVREVFEPQSQWRATVSPVPVTVKSGARVTGVDFANWIPIFSPSSIAGIKWEDLDGDGEKDPNENGLAGWTIFLDGNGNGVLDAPTTETLANENSQPIPDFTTVTSTLVFEGLSSIRDLDLTLDITHSFVSDLDIYLISPTGTQVEIVTDVGGEFNDFQNTIFDDEADTPIIAGTAPFNDRYRPEGLLSDFDGENPNGVWQLVIRDTAFGDQGTLNGWSLTFLKEEQSTVTDEAGNYSFTELSPGSYNVSEVLQPGWVQTAPAIPTGKTWWEITLGAGDSVPDANFGNEQAVLLPGDYNGDSVVDSGDYTIWRSTVGSSVDPYTGADGSGNGVVDEADRLVWFGNFGRVLSEGASAAASFQALAAGEEENSQAPASEVSSVALTAAPIVRDALFAHVGNERTARPIASQLPVADRVDAALLAWLADRQDRPDRAAQATIRREHSDETDNDEATKPLVTALDDAFAELSV